MNTPLRLASNGIYLNAKQLKAIKLVLGPKATSTDLKAFLLTKIVEDLKKKQIFVASGGWRLDDVDPNFNELDNFVVAPEDLPADAGVD